MQADLDLYSMFYFHHHVIKLPMWVKVLVLRKCFENIVGQNGSLISAMESHVVDLYKNVTP